MGRGGDDKKHSPKVRREPGPMKDAGVIHKIAEDKAKEPEPEVNKLKCSQVCSWAPGREIFK